MARFLEWLGQLAKWWFIIAGVIATGFFILVFMAVSSLKDVTTITTTTPAQEVEDMPDEAMLHLNLEGSLRHDRPDVDNVWAGFAGLQERQTFVSDIHRGLRKAASDDRIKGLWITTGAIMSSATAINELRRVIEEFKAASKKPVKIHAAILTNPVLLLASAADEVIIPPLADIHVPGPQFQLTYFGDAVDKLGFGFDVVKAGKYKSAMEPMTSDAPSAASQEMYRAMLKASSSFFITTISAGRNQPAEKVQGWFDEAVFSPEQAIAAGLADRMGYAEDFSATFASSLKAESYKFSVYIRRSGAELLTSSNSSPIAIIDADGEITSLAASGDEGITPRRMLKRLDWALAEDDIKAVVLRVNSPGGSANASDIIWKEIRRLESKKPVVVLMTDVAASGGYFLAAGGSKIVADPLTITGSIGVIYAATYGPKVKEKYGVSFHVLAEPGRQARSFNEPLSPAEKARLEGSIAYTYSNFLDRVALGRGQEKARIAPLAEGRVYTGKEALALGLVDELGGLTEAVALAQKLAKIDGDPWPLRTYSTESPFRQAFEMMSAFQTRGGWDELVSAAAGTPSAAKNLRLWKHWAKNRVALSYWPYHGQLQ